MSSLISIAKDLRPLLLAKEDLAEMVGGNIFPLYAPEDTTGDFILYQRTNGGSEQTLMGVSTEWCEVTFNVVSEKYTTSVDIAEQLRLVLQDIYIDNNHLVLTKSREDFVGENNIVKYVQILVFSCGKPKE